MSAALALQSVDSSRRFITRKYLVTLSGNYTASGDAINFLTATNPKYLESAAPGYGISMSDANVKISLPNPGGVGYLFRVQKGTTFANSLLRIFQSDDAVDPLDEISGAIPAALTGDTNIFVELTTPVGF